MAIVSEYLTVIGTFFQVVGAITKKACLPLLMRLVLGIKIRFETDDQRMLDISEKCNEKRVVQRRWRDYCILSSKRIRIRILG